MYTSDEWNIGITITCIIRNAPLGVVFFPFISAAVRGGVHFLYLYLNMAGNYTYTGETSRKRQSASHGGNTESDLAACWIGLKRQLWTFCTTSKCSLWLDKKALWLPVVKLESKDDRGLSVKNYGFLYNNKE